MRNILRYMSALSAVVVTGLSVHTSVSAQGTRLLSAPTASTADQLEAVAVQQKEDAHDWMITGQTLEQAAQLRSAKDVQGINDLIMASEAFTTAGAYSEARAALEHAGQRADRAGQYGLAARAYTGVFEMSAQQGDDEVAARYLDLLASIAFRPGVPEPYRDVVRALDHMHYEF